MRTAKRIIWTAALAGLVLGGAALGGEGKANRGRSGERYRNRDPHGPHTGMRHRNGQLDQGWHGGKKKNEDGGEGAGAGRKGRCRGRAHGMFRRRFGKRVRNMEPGRRDELVKRFKEKFEDLDPKQPWKVGEKRGEGRRGRPGMRLGQRPGLRERFKQMDPEKRQELRKRLMERFKKMRGQRGRGQGHGRPGMRRGQRRHLRERLQNLPPEKQAEIKKKLKGHWDRGLHRGKDAGKCKGGGGFGRNRTKWDDYEGKPGRGNVKPAGPKAK